MSNITLPLPEVYLPSGRYAVSFKSCPLVPGEPGAKMSIPLSVPAPPPQIASDEKSKWQRYEANPSYFH